MQSKADLIDAQDILRFFKAAGVDEAVADLPVDAFAFSARPPARQAAEAKANPPVSAAPPNTAPAQPPNSAAPARMPPQSAHIAHDTWLQRAQSQAAGAQSLDDLKQRIAAFDGCSLKFTAKNTCIADGTVPQPLMLVGEGPGAEEDRQALPFVGRAGQLLNLILAAIGFTRESLLQAAAAADNAEQAAAKQCAYITNAVFWRPPGNRTPTVQEIALCRPFLERQIELVRPKMLISLGGVAATALLGRPQSILRLRGHWHAYKTVDGQEIPYMPSLHPAFLLRSPAQKKAAWQDFLAAKMRLKELGAA